MIQSAARDHVEVVLDHDQRMAGGDQPAERAEQLRDVVEVQAGRRLVEQEQRAARVDALRVRGDVVGCAGEVSGELQPLRFAAGERRHRLAEPQVVEADVGERRERGVDVALAGEERARLARPSSRARRRSTGLRA